MAMGTLLGAKRILIIGCCGSGKSVLTQKLSAITGLPAVHLDTLFWKPGWVQPADDEFDEIVAHACEETCWILDGNYARTLPARLARAELVIYLRYPRWRCIYGVLKRVLTSLGRVRPDMAPGCPERLDFSFLRYCWNFEKTQTSKITTALADYHGRVIVFHNRKETETFCASLKQTLVFNA